MKAMTSAEIRAAYLRFFEERGHKVVPSSPLVPANDPTLLFTNAGMVQFKDALLGLEDRGYYRATSSQRCVRAGGKHNDLENVGYTARHHTFFEMLGNFSFGDYFKDDAIAFGWQFSTEVLGLDPDRLWITVHTSDDEAESIWVDRIGVPKDRVVRLGDKDNFWAMGDTGPCGPCTEMFYDHGPDVAGGPPGSPDEDGDRYIEFWNHVFPQYDRQPGGELQPMAKPGVDTGMGLERITAIMQGVHSNYEIDTFRGLFAAAGRFTGIDSVEAAIAEPSLRVIVDHIRSGAFLVTDGVLPASEGRGYVLRRIVRRALRHGHKLGMREGFFHQLVAPLADEMGEAYPELVKARSQVEKALKREEEQFSRTLDQGMELLERELGGMQGNTIAGDVVFRLYDTYGFPVDLTADIARERGLSIDEAGFEAAMDEQRNRGRSASRFAASLEQSINVEGGTAFSGYEGTAGSATVRALYRIDDSGQPQAVERLGAGDGRGVVVLDETPFYAESGGQVGDTGELTWVDGRFAVEDTTKGSDNHLHQGLVTAGTLEVGAAVTATVDAGRRDAIRLNHSATHLLHAALREVLGSHVEQKGSLVDAERLRFDFSHPEPVTPDELRAIEDLVNREIRRNSAVQTELMDFDTARERGAIALFGEKYDDEVRVLTMGDGFSVELCGGTHARRTGDIGVLRISAETGIASGVRRIEAVTGDNALRRIDATEAALDAVAAAVRGTRDDAAQKVGQLVEQQRALQKRVEQLEAKLASGAGRDLADDAVDVGGVKVLAAQLASVDPKALPKTMDNLKSKLGSAVVVLASEKDGRVNLVAGVTKDLTDRFNAGDLVNHVGGQVGAKGGGRPDMARAGGGDNPAALDGALASVQAWVAGQG